MKKRIFLIILCLAAVFACAFGLAACGGGDDGGSGSDNTQTEQSTNTQKGTYDMSGVVFANSTVTYDGQEHSIIATNLPEGVTATYEGNGKVNVGTYTVTAHFTGDNEKYETIPDKTANLTIQKRELGIEFQGEQTIVYDGQVHKEVTATLTNLVGNDEVALALTYSGEMVEAGEYTVIATIEENDKYVLTENNTYTVIITRATHTVTFKQEGQPDVTVTVPDLGSVKAEDIPAPVDVLGYDVAWENVDLTVITADVIVNIVKTPIIYTITYHLNGGTNSKDNQNTYTIEDTVELFAAARTGYSFEGWFADEQFDDPLNGIEQGTIGNLNLYAKWYINSYTITFESNGGHEVPSITQEYGSTVTEPEAPVREKYYFLGWYLSESDSEKYEFTTMPGENITLYARWEDYKLTISYNQTKKAISALRTITTEDFDAVCTDNSGKTIEIAVSYSGTLEGGKTITVLLSASANGVASQVSLTDIKVYGNPAISISDEFKDCFVDESDSIDLIFAAYDSFGEELLAQVVADSEIVAGTFVNITVTATDIIGNTIKETFKFGVTSESVHYVELYLDDELWKAYFVEGVATDYTLPIPEELSAFVFPWQDISGTDFTDLEGNGIRALEKYNKLYVGPKYNAIYTAEQLKNISMNGEYILMADIDLDNEEWIPLGTSANPFTGVFDGNGRTISNFKITSSSIEYIGLFAYNSGTIRNLGVETFTINISRSSGYAYAGGLVGYNDGEISNCYATGSVTLKGTASSALVKVYAGGLVGYSTKTISNCHATGSVTASSQVTVPATSTAIPESYACAGGLVGYNDGEISNCYATGSVTANGNLPLGSFYALAYAGGLVGYNTQTISNCYATGTVTANGKPASPGSSSFTNSANVAAYAGGLVGYNTKTISNCYATGTVTAESNSTADPSTVYAYAGGLVGYNGGTISNCYAAGSVKARSTNSYSSPNKAYSYAGGLVASGYGTITNCYRSSSQSVSSTAYASNSNGNSTNTSGTATSLSILRSVSFLTDTLEWSADVWNFVDGQYPTLR